MMERVVLSDLEKERRTAIFVMRNFVPEEQQRKVNLEFIMQQLRRSPISPNFIIQYPNPMELHQSTSRIIDESSEDWQDLMRWMKPSLLDTIEMREVHLFQWERTSKFLNELMSGLRGTAASSPMLEMQRKEIIRFIQAIRERRNKIQGLTKGDATTCNNNYNNKRMNVCWILWKLRGLLATIPTPATKAACGTAHTRLMKFHEDLGIMPFTKLNQWIIRNPDQYLLYLATVCWFPEPPPA